MPLHNPQTGRAGHSQSGWRRRWRALRAVGLYTLVVAALLAASEMLWLWHSWPVRHVLDSEKSIAGAML